MGGSSSKSSKTEVVVKLNREVFQAGAFLNGQVEIKIGADDVKAFTKFTQGGLVELQLFGCERTFWVKGQKHDTKRQPGTSARSQLQNNNVVEQANILHDMKQQLTIPLMQLTNAG